MLEKWNSKDDKIYKDTKQRAIKDGADEGRARELAAQAVSRQREEDKRSSDHPLGNNPVGKKAEADSELELLSYRELFNRAESMKIEGRHDMDREALMAAIRRRHP